MDSVYDESKMILTKGPENVSALSAYKPIIKSATNSSDEMTRQYRAMIADNSAEATEEEWWDTLKRANALSMEGREDQAIHTLRGVVKRLPEGRKARLADSFLRDDKPNRNDYIAFREARPSMANYLRDEKFAQVYGNKNTLKGLGTVGRIYNSFPVKAVRAGWAGYMQGQKSFEFGREANYAKSLDSPEFLAEKAEYEAIMADLARDMEEIGAADSLFYQFFSNFGQMGGGLTEALTSPEAAAGAAVGGAVGAAAGGVGAAPGSIVGWWGIGLPAAFSISTAGQLRYQAEQSGVDPKTAQIMGAVGGVISGLLEAVGGNVQAFGTEPVKKALGQTLTQKISAGTISREAAKDLAERVGAEVSTEAVEAVIETGALDAAAALSDTPAKSKRLNEYAEAINESMFAAAWGGSFLGMAAVGSETAYKIINKNKINAAVDIRETAAKAGALRAGIVAAENNNADLRENSKALVAKVREGALPDAPEMNQAMLRSEGERTAFIDGDIVLSLAQEAVDGYETTFEALQTELFEPLGLNLDELRDNEGDHVSVEIDLSGLASVAKHNLIDGMVEHFSAEPPEITPQLEAELNGLYENPPRVIQNPLDEVNPEIHKALVQYLVAGGRTRSQANAESELAIRMAANLTRSTGESVNSFLSERLRIGRAGTPDGGAVSYSQPAMYRAQAETIEGFIEEAKASDPSGERPFFHLNNNFGDTVIELGAAQVSHITAGHPEFSEWDRIPEVIERGKATFVGRNEATGTDSFVYTLEDGDSTLVVIAAPAVGGKGRKNKPTRTVVLTAFRDSSEAVKNWLENNKAASPPIESAPSRAKADAQPAPITSPQSGNSNISKIESEVNKEKSLFQGERGRTDINTSDWTYRVIFTESADASTAIHELNHVFVNEALRVRNFAPEKIVDKAAHDQLMADLATLEEWAGVADGQWTREAHEKVATGFEQYLMEGQAPVKALAGIFGRMKKWLLDVYKNIKALGEPLTNDVRKVFDRMVATDEEILMNEWQSEPALPLTDFDNPEYREMFSDDELKKYSEATDLAKEATERAMAERRLKEYNQRVKQWRREAHDEYDNDRDQQALRRIREGGINPLSLAAAGYDKDAIAALQKRLPGALRSDSVLGLDEWAAELQSQAIGDGTGDSIKEFISNVPTRTEFIDNYIKQQEEYFEAYDSGEIVMPDEVFDKMAIEREMLQKIMKKSGLNVQNSFAFHASPSWREQVRRLQIKEDGKTLDATQKEILASLKKKLRDKVSGVLSGEAITQGAWNDLKDMQFVVNAYNRLDKALATAAKFRVASETRAFKDKTIAKFRKVAAQKMLPLNSKTGIDPETLSQIKNILALGGIGRGAETVRQLNDFLQAKSDEGYAVVVPEWIADGLWPKYDNKRGWASERGGTKSMGSLTVTQLKDVDQAIENLLFIGRRSKEVIVDGKRQNLAQAEADLLGSIDSGIGRKKQLSQKELIERAGDKSFGRRIIDTARGYIASTIKIGEY